MTNTFSPDKPKGLSTTGVSLMPSMDQHPEACCDSGPDPSRPELAGYTLCDHVEDFMETQTGPVPRIKTKLSFKDRMSTAFVRCGINRHRYTVSPGLYAVGTPGGNSEVLVTANFKLTFDHLRKELSDLNVWILVLDTKGINVWCAAGKGTFSTREVADRIGSSNLDRVVEHRRVIVPQLGATGVSARKVKSKTGFRVVYGPIRASDIPKFLENRRKANPAMREVTFTFMERLVLTPVEVQIVLKPFLITALVVFIISGFGPGFFSFAAAWSRGFTGLGALMAGLVSGAIITPVLLPFIPVREFALKGIISGSAAAIIMILAMPSATASLGTGLALFLFITAISSFLAMNFTGTTPFTSPSGVEKEMKRYMPIQFICLIAAIGFWIKGAF